MKINNIKQLIRETLEDLLIKKFKKGYYFDLPPGIEGRNFFKDLTGIHDYDKVYQKKNNELPETYKNWEAKLKYMTMEEYFQECADLQYSDIETQINTLLEETVNKITANMLSGTKYDMPYIDYVRGNQEGRHRVAAAARLGQKKIPVMLIDKSQKAYREEARNIKYMLGTWDDLVQMGSNYYCIFEGNDWKSMSQVLSRIVSNYDDYYLDHLFDVRLYPSIKSIEEFLKTEKNTGYIKDFNQFLNAYAIMKNNENVIYDAVKIENGSFLLKVLTDRIEEEYPDYSSCKEMLIETVNRDYYVKEYNLVDDSSNLEISSNYIKEARKLFKEA